MAPLDIKIQDRFYPSLIEMELCADILYHGLKHHMGTSFMNKADHDNLKQLTADFSIEFKQHQKGIIESMIKELDNI